MNKIIVLTLLMLLSGFAIADVQDDRAAFIQTMISDNIFSQVQVSEDDGPVLIVTNKFFESDYIAQSDVTGVVYRYYSNSDAAYEAVSIVNSSGTPVGLITAAGLQLF